MIPRIKQVLKSRTANRIASVFFNNGVRQILTLLISVLVARIYGPIGRGEYALFASLTTVIALVCSVGLVTALIYQMKKGALSLKQSVRLLCTHSGVAICIVALIFSGVKILFDPALIDNDYPIWKISALFFLYYNALLLNLLLTSHLLAIGDIRNHRRQMILIPTSTVVTFVAGYILLGQEDFHPVYSLVAGECFSVVLILVYLTKWDGPSEIPRSVLNDTYSYAIRGYVSGLTNTILSRVDNLVLGAYAGIESIGIYATAKSFYQVIKSVPMAFSGYLFGLFVERGFADGGRLVFKSSGAIFILTLCAALPLFMDPSLILDFIYGPDFAKAADTVMILAIAAVIAGISSPILGFLNAHNRPGASSIISVISALLTVACLFMFVPSMSYLGAAYASLIGALMTLILRYGYFLNLTQASL